MLISCGSNSILTLKKQSINCPIVLFASEHKRYLGSNSSSFSIDDVAYKAEINNYNFSKGCFINNNTFTASLSILFIVSPMMEKQNTITLPFYIAIIDKEKNIRDINIMKIEISKKYNVNDKIIKIDMMFYPLNNYLL